MAEQKATNVHRHEGDINSEHRNQLLGQKARLFGLPVYRAVARVPLRWH